jgi:hypothetical protein
MDKIKSILAIFGLFFPCFMSAFAQQVSLFDSNGEARAYIDLDKDATIFRWDGTPVAFIKMDNNEICIFGFSGKFLGWYESGIMYDKQGYAVGVKKGAVNMIYKLEGIKGIQKIIPIRPIAPITPIKPIWKNSWSSTNLAEFLHIPPPTSGYKGQSLEIINEELPEVIRPNVDYAGKVGDNLQRQWDESQQRYYKLNNAISNVQVNPYASDLAIKQDVQKIVENKIGVDAREGNFLKIKNDLLQLANDIAKHEGLNRVIRSYAERTAFHKKIDATEGWSDAQKWLYKQYVENTRDHSVHYNPYTGEVEGGYQGIGMAKWVNMGNYIRDAVNLVSKSNVDGIISVEDIYRAVLAYFNVLPEVNAFMRQWVDLDLFSTSLAKDAFGNYMPEKDGKLKTIPLNEMRVKEKYVQPNLTDLAGYLGRDFVDFITPLPQKSTTKQQTEKATRDRLFLQNHKNAVDVQDLFDKYQSELREYLANKFVGGEEGKRSQDDIREMAYIGYRTSLLKDMLEKSLR